MDRRRNPFAPGAGNQPPELAGRARLMEDAEVAVQRSLDGRPTQGQILVGLRGVGKTVLLNRIWSLATAQNCQCALIEADMGRSLVADLIPELRRVLFALDIVASASDKVKRGIRVLRSFTSGLKVKSGELEFEFAGVEPERGSADSGSLEVDLPALLVAVAEAARDRGTAVVICIDELQNLTESEFSALIGAVHRTSQRGLPLLLIGAGLPQILALAGRAKSYAERLFQYPLVGPLDATAASEALVKPVEQENAFFAEDAVAYIQAQTEGYPYFLQEWGKEAWNVAAGPVITLADVTSAHENVLSNLDRNFFRVRFDRLTPLEQQYLHALAELGAGSHRSGEVARQLGVSTNRLGPRRDGLVKKGMIYSPAYGDVAFTVPLFDSFMRRTMDLGLG